MYTYLIRRILLLFPTLIGITIVVFTVMALSPGGISANVNEGMMRPGEREYRKKYYEARYGLGAPAPIQYLRWLNRVSPLGFPYKKEGGGEVTSWIPTFKAPDLGESFKHNRPVGSLIMERLPITLLLNLITIPIIYFIAINIGVKAARNRGRAFDIVSGAITLALWSIPTMLAGILLIGFLANVQYIQAFPVGGLDNKEATAMPFLPSFGPTGELHRGYLCDVVWHLFLPVICLTYGGFAFLSKLTRTAVLENLLADYARTARAKGLDEKKIMWRHVFRNSLLPLITVASHILPALLAGSIIVESVFSINGMGRLAVESVQGRDREVVLSITLISGLLTLIGYLLADICYAIADPRVSYE